MIESLVGRRFQIALLLLYIIQRRIIHKSVTVVSNRPLVICLMVFALSRTFCSTRSSDHFLQLFFQIYQTFRNILSHFILFLFWLIHQFYMVTLFRNMYKLRKINHTFYCILVLSGNEKKRLKALP